MDYTSIADGSVTTPAGYLAAGVCAGLKASGTPDLALLVSECPAVAAAAFTSNALAAAPVQYDRELMAAGGPIRAVVINSGNANSCTGAPGLANVRVAAAFTAELLCIDIERVLVSSTGRIGVPLPMDVIKRGIRAATEALSADGGRAAAQAIMTTDTVPKSVAVAVDVDGRTVHIGGMTKGAGMIAPRMVRAQRREATMLAYVTTDAAVTRDFLDLCLEQSLDKSFNRITVDGDTSTNDTVVALANGRAGNTALDGGTADSARFQAAFDQVLSRLAREMVLDGEGVTRFVEVQVSGALTDREARQCAETIARSQLVKTAWFGGDPNWGRILDAAGYSGVQLEPEKIALDFAGVPIVRNGMDAGTPEAKKAEAVSVREFRVDLDLGVGQAEFTVWTCDLTYDYIKINADYHT